MTRALKLMLSCALLLATQATAQAQSANAEVNLESDDDDWSTMEYGFYGLGAGAGIGLAAGYLATGPTYQDGEWRTIAIGTGVGALGGIGAGLILGIVDMQSEADSAGATTLENIGYGVSLGLVAGLAAGGIYAINSGDAEDALVGGSIGLISGAGVGAILGLIEGISEESNDPELARAGGMDVTLSTTRDDLGNIVWMPTAYGTF